LLRLRPPGADKFPFFVDLSMTQGIDGDLVKIMSRYDNEWGYACQMIRLALAEKG
jgi:glyceraldehyde 3-phosphate dehydrogenase